MATSTPILRARRRATSRAATTTKAAGSLAPMPGNIEPMLAMLADLPHDPQNYAFEYKWDGVRALAYLDRGKLTLCSRNDLSITHRYPELHAIVDAVGSRRRAILDGEIVSLDDAGRPSFAKLQKRMHIASAATAARLALQAPVWYVLFDILYLDGRWLGDLPLTRRRELLESLTLQGPNWQVSPSHVGEGQPMLDAARLNQLEGIMAKRLDSTYEPGRRSPAWRKIKVVQRQEFVVGGWVPESTGHANRVGSLLLGYFDAKGTLRYAGKMGSGFDAETHPDLVRRLIKLARATSPFADPTDVRTRYTIVRGVTRFVEPELVIEVEYRRWPADGMIQQATFLGIRDDKDSRQVVHERVCAPPASDAA